MFTGEVLLSRIAVVIAVGFLLNISFLVVIVILLFAESLMGWPAPVTLPLAIILALVMVAGVIYFGRHLLVKYWKSGGTRG